MEFEKARDSWNCTENHLTTDLAILQALALGIRIVLRFFSGNSSYIPYTSGQIFRQYSTAHAGGQNCSCRLIVVTTVPVAENVLVHQLLQCQFCRQWPNVFFRRQTPIASDVTVGIDLGPRSVFLL
jgi:hypothetical protein